MLGYVNLDQRYDVIVGGGGNAGLCAAISACERGKRVLVLVKDSYETRGGHSKYAECVLVAHEEGWHGLRGLSADDYYKLVMRSSKGNADPRLLKFFVENSMRYAEFVEGHGVRWINDLKHGISHYRLESPNRLYMLGGGQGLVNALYHWLERRGGCKVVYNAEIVRINAEDGVFKSLEAIINGSRATLRADNLILATGGFEGNVELLRRIWGERFEYIRFRASTVNTGLPIFEMERNGAAMVGRMDEGIHPIVDARVPKFNGGVIDRDYSIPFGVTVNVNVERIFDEGLYAGGVTEVTYTRILLEQPGGIAYSIFDSKVWGMFKPHAYPPIKADTLEDLARKLELDPDRLVSLVKRFNSSIVPGKDYTVGIEPPKSRNARPIDTPPFYAYPLAPGFSFTRYGVKVNEEARVIRRNNRPFENVFAAGTTMVGNILTGDEYLGCFDIPLGGFFGIVAGENLW
jgi:tricarballylate dehydrogenase